MRFAWFKTGIFAALILSAAAAGAQLNPHTNVRWPANCSSSGNMVYNALNNTCIASGTAANPAGSNTQVQYNQGGIMGAYTNSGLLNFMVPGATVDGSNSVVLPSGLTAPKATASVNKVLTVTAPPYNAKCDGVTDDQAAIQTAFTDALVVSSNDLCAGTGCLVQFPAGICVTSTIAHTGQSFFGAGPASTIIRGKPGQDVFQGPDGNVTYTNSAYVHDFQVQVDASVNKASSAVGGDNTFLNRVFGVVGSSGVLTNPPTFSAISPAIAPGPMKFGPGTQSGCSGSVTSGNTTLTLSCGAFTSVRYTSQIVGQPVTLTAMGSAGADLVTTVSSVTDASHVVLALAPSATSSTVAGTLGTGITPPWYCGNAGFAYPNSDQSQTVGGFTKWVWRNVLVTSINRPTVSPTYTCGMFFQAAPYGHSFQNIEVTQFWGGYVEASPVAHLGVWTADTSSYKDMNFNLNTIPFVLANGTHRQLDSINIYSSGEAFLLGMFQLIEGPNFASATVNHIYNECFSLSSGEFSRFMGNNNTFGGGGMSCGMTNQYVLWTGNSGTSNSTNFPGLHVTGKSNVFNNAAQTTATSTLNISDTGTGNRIFTSINPASLTTVNLPVYTNSPKEPTGKIDGSFLISGNSTTPYNNASDLLIRCEEFNFAFQNGANPTSGCTADPTGTEQTKSYAHLLGANYGAFSMNHIASSQGAGPYGGLLTIGGRLPKVLSTLQVTARCDISCPAVVTVKNGVTILGQATLTFGTSFTIQTMSVDLATSTAVGDSVDVQITSPYAAGNAYIDLASLAFEPQNTDTLTAAAASPAIGRTIQGSIGVGNYFLSPCNFSYNTTTTCATDTASPWSQQKATFTTSHFYQLLNYNGTALTIGNQIQAGSTYQFSFMAYADVGFTESVSFFCGATSLGNQSLVLTTAFTATPITVTEPFTDAACTAGATVLIQFNTPSQQMYLGSLTITNLSTAATTFIRSTVAPLASPAFTGTPTAPTAAAATNTTQVATTAFVQTAVTTGNPRVASGYCVGTATSSTTLVLFGLGAGSANCTVAVGAGNINSPIMPAAGTLKNLTVRCNSTGVGVSSGVFTVFAIPSGTGANSGTNTGLTVTFGTTTAGTVVQDTTHTYNYSAGDMLQVRFTTQATETLATCIASVNY